MKSIRIKYIKYERKKYSVYLQICTPSLSILKNHVIKLLKSRKIDTKCNKAPKILLNVAEILL